MATQSPSIETSMAAATSCLPVTSIPSEETTREVQISQEKVEVKVSILEQREEDPEQGLREWIVIPKPKV